MPLFILFGGEIFLIVAVVRVAVWVLRGWRDFDAGPPNGPPGPKGGLPLARPQLVLLRGGHTRALRPLRRAGVRRPRHPWRKVRTIGASARESKDMRGAWGHSSPRGRRGGT
ncbi:MAG TPA: hypothetical protein DEP35_08030 [Deltaproteobacteria bacterium]|jgi:hypothetical protein|nr:hypothetical protein [Deltaproteobacteria bacterium]